MGLDTIHPRYNELACDLIGFASGGESYQGFFGELGVEDPLLQFLIEECLRVANLRPSVIGDDVDRPGNSAVLAGGDGGIRPTPAIIGCP